MGRLPTIKADEIVWKRRVFKKFANGEATHGFDIPMEGW